MHSARASIEQTAKVDAFTSAHFQQRRLCDSLETEVPCSKGKTILCTIASHSPIVILIPGNSNPDFPDGSPGIMKNLPAHTAVNGDTWASTQNLFVYVY